MWLLKTSGPSRRQDFRVRRLDYVPAFESLEERCLLSAGYVQTNLISDLPGLARFTDPNLINPWGLSRNGTDAWWLADNGTGVSTVNSGDGRGSPADQPLIVTVPGSDSAAVGRPTGTVFYFGDGFKVSHGGQTGASLFLFATQDGTISGWSPEVDLTHTFVAVDASATPGHGPVYTGLAVATTSTGSFLYAANFRSGAVDVFDKDFQPVHRSGAFTDPSLPAGFAPFNVQDIDGSVYVAYTNRDTGRYDVDLGQGNGFVDVFDADGTFLRRAVSGGPLAVPWGLALAPSDFGEFSNDLLVGNFADGRINAFDPHSGAFLGQLHDSAGEPIALPGLWALAFGNDHDAGPSNVLYFAAGIGTEQHGLFGSLQPDSAGVAAGVQRTIGDALAAAPTHVASAAPGDDGYPLPPTSGPALHNGSTQSEQLAVLLPLDGAPLSVVPTLLSGGQGNSGFGTQVTSGSGTATPTPASPANMIGYVLSLPANLGSSSPANIPPRHIPAGETVNDLGANRVSGGDGSEAPQPLPALVQNLPETIEPATNLSQNTQTLSAQLSGPELVALDEIPPPPEAQPAVKQAPASQEAPSQDLVPPGQEERHVALAMFSVPPGVPNSGPVWLQTVQDLVVLLLAWYGIRLTWSRHLLSSPAALTRIKSLWSRSTRQPSKTVQVNPEALSPRDLAATRVIVVRH